jgi:hypothetical protein
MLSAGVAVLLALPPVLGAWPARQSPVSAATLLAAVQRSGAAGYSGYAEAVGGLELPLADQFSSLADLFGGRTRLRVWWRERHDWRVDAVGATGETDVYQAGAGTWTWEYERSQATVSGEPPVRLPQPADLDPAQLGRRLLAEAVPAEVTRLPARRVAGVDAPGLRLAPGDPRTTVTRVDVWADPGIGVVLRLDLYGSDQRHPALQSRFLDFTARTPDPRVTSFRPPPDATVSALQVRDLAAEVDRFARFLPPDELAGYPLRRRAEEPGAVGTYGRGVVVLIAVPLSGWVSRPLRETLGTTRGARVTAAGTLLAVGPLSLLLSGAAAGGPSWLLAGTVTAETLQRASADLAAHPPGAR